MARPGLTKHRKFLRLSRMIGSEPMALGCLEFIWDACYQNGDPFLGDGLDVETTARWGGEPGKLTKALLEAGGEGAHGFIEAVEDRPGCYRCHDLFDHAPRYVGKRLAREVERQENGMSISKIRAEAGRKGAEAKLANGQQMVGKQSANERSFAGDSKQMNATPAPAPAPAQELQQEAPPPAALEKKQRKGKAEKGSLDVPDLPAWVPELAVRLKAAWPTSDPDGRKITVEMPLLVARLAAIHRRQPRFDEKILEGAATDYLRSQRQRYKAPQYFFTETPDPNSNGKPPFYEWAVSRVHLAERGVPKAPAAP